MPKCLSFVNRPSQVSSRPTAHRRQRCVMGSTSRTTPWRGLGMPTPSHRPDPRHPGPHPAPHPGMPLHGFGVHSPNRQVSKSIGDGAVADSFGPPFRDSKSPGRGSWCSPSRKPSIHGTLSHFWRNQGRSDLDSAAERCSRSFTACHAGSHTGAFRARGRAPLTSSALG